MDTCIARAKPHYPTFEAASEHGTPEWCESCHRWTYIPEPRAKLPRCDAGPHFTYASSAARCPDATVCKCGGLLVPTPTPTPIEPPTPMPALRKLDLEAAQRSCFSKKAYSAEIANKIATERGLRVYSCAICGRYHLTKTTLRGHKQ